VVDVFGYFGWRGRVQENHDAILIALVEDGHGSDHALA
jgi:hypothetical protein